MHTLSTLKAAEVKLRESAKRERIPEFKRDIQWALGFVRARRRMAERRIFRRDEDV